MRTCLSWTDKHANLQSLTRVFIILKIKTSGLRLILQELFYIIGMKVSFIIPLLFTPIVVNSYKIPSPGWSKVVFLTKIKR